MSSPFSAVLLAGGKSSRMGRDKAFIPFEGEPLWQRQLGLLKELQPRELFIAAPPHEAWPRDAVVLADAGEDVGPLGGLLSGLRRASTPLLLALAVDLPRMTGDYLRTLLLSSSPAHGVVPRGEPVVGVYPVTTLPVAESCLVAQRYSMRDFALRCAELGFVRLVDIAPADEPLFLNLNTPADLLAATAGARSTTIIAHRRDGVSESRPDHVAVEEPLEIRVEGHSVAVVMRTPGHDRELAAGFLRTENLIRRAADIFDITQCGSSAADHVVNVTLRDPSVFDRSKLTRNVFSSSSCGVCSKATIAAVRQSFPAIDDNVRVRAETVLALPGRFREKQETFERTGGLHACALFDSSGQLQSLREDVGRHNALDKLIGCALLDDLLPLRGRILFLSGRVSFEMMQKALAAGIPIVAAISAPTSLAVEFARESQQTLIGFVRGETMNIYAGEERMALNSS